MKRTGILFLIAVIAVGTACHAAKATDSAAGTQLYQANCATCHGAGTSGTNLGALVVPDIRAQVLKSDYTNDTALIKGAILNGKDADGEDLDAAMPRFSGKLSDSDVSAIITHLQFLQ
jgi:mono/diheme cytochrome c family protein